MVTIERPSSETLWYGSRQEKFHFGVAVAPLSHQRSYATSSAVSTGIGDDLWRVYHPGIYPGHSAWPSLVG